MSDQTSSPDAGDAESKPKPKKRRVKPITVQEYSAKRGVGERKVRRTLRSLDLGVGRGGRYTMSAAVQRKCDKALGLRK